MSRHIITRLDKNFIINLSRLWLAESPIVRFSSSSLNFSLPNYIGRRLSSVSLVHNLLGTASTKYMHMAFTAKKEITYDDLLILRKTDVTIIDVRESGEIRASGSVPGSFNIPSQQVESALQRHPDEFVFMYGRRKPNENDNLLFYCQRGVRSKEAMEKAIQMGFKNAVSLKGGWEEFSKKSN